MTLTALQRADTSWQARQSMEPHLERLERDVVDALRLYASGLTCDELERVLNLSHQTCSARVNTLWRKGILCKAGVTRKTRSGRAAQVYVLG